VPRILNRRYELHHAIGAGGAATVYRGTDRQLHRDVAVKLLNDVAARSADPGGRERFLREARTGAAVHHHNLVDIYDAGEDNGVLYLVMELVQGSSLATLIADRAPLPVDEAVGIATEILGGLSALHATGTIHRDVKPANVLVDETGEVRLTDFGIAKRLDEIEGALTSDDTVIGTPSYIAPEQAAGSGLSAATDVYAVGLVLYEMLTGRRAFERESPMSASPGDDPLPLDPRSVRPEVPDHVARAVVQATHRDPARRFADAATMAHVLTDGPPTALAGTATLVMPAGLQPPGHPDRTQRMPAAAAMQSPSDGRRMGILATLLAAGVLLVGLVALAGRAGTGDSDPPSNPSIAPAIPTDDSLPAAPVATVAPETVAPPTLPPPPPPPRAVPGDRGRSDEQNGNERDEDDDDVDDDDDDDDDER
jgi:eukaryotic-like serine/threonine-protein kinase